MPRYNLPNITDGIDNVIVGTSSTVPIFPPMLLIFIFFTVLIGGLVSQRRRTGNVDFPMWTVMASITTLLVTLIMSLTTGILTQNPLILPTVIAITVFSGLWLFFDKNKNEI